jgi:hypothetical protein
MSVSQDRNIWIPSRVPQTLACFDCGRTLNFVGFQEPDHYQYTCPACRATQVLSLAQINATEAHRFHRLPNTTAQPIISSRMTGAAKP